MEAADEVVLVGGDFEVGQHFDERRHVGGHGRQLARLAQLLQTGLADAGVGHAVRRQRLVDALDLRHQRLRATDSKKNRST